MKLRFVGSLVMVACCQQGMFATVCRVPPPCALVRRGSILFLGTVMDVGPQEEDKEQTRAVVFHVDEAFMGIAKETKEVSLKVEGSWLARGHSYLIDAVTDQDKQLSPALCGASGEITKEPVQSVLEYLRQRAQGKVNTSFMVRVEDPGGPMPDVDVTIGVEGAKEHGRTGEDGTVTFNAIKPAKYHVSVSRSHYRIGRSSTAGQDVDVPLGACEISNVLLQADATVSGVVVDHKGVPVASLELELEATEGVRETMPLRFRATTKTREDGTFRFDSVSPGRYFLGSNLMVWSGSPIPRTYYPGQRTESGAVPIEVKLGERVDKLLFTLPDFGERRNIELCVVDENGKPASSVEVETDFLREGEDFAALGEELVTDASGCVRTTGYTRAAYAVHASLRAPEPIDRLLAASSTFIVQPGDAPVRVVLQLQ